MGGRGQFWLPSRLGTTGQGHRERGRGNGWTKARPNKGIAGRKLVSNCAHGTPRQPVARGQSTWRLVVDPERSGLLFRRGRGQQRQLACEIASVAPTLRCVRRAAPPRKIEMRSPAGLNGRTAGPTRSGSVLRSARLGIGPSRRDARGFLQRATTLTHPARTGRRRLTSRPGQRTARAWTAPRGHPA